jgi:mono/diheme cytochrome c family protein
MRWGLVVLVVIMAAGAWFWLRYKASGFSAQQPPSALEEFSAITARKLAMPSSARRLHNPVPNTPEAIAEGKMHWADHCAICHANNGSGNTEMGPHMYPRAPDMREGRTQNLADGELYFIIQNGIRLSGMPAWGKAGEVHDEESWKLVHFMRHLPSLTAEEEQQMKQWNPVSPQERQNEQEEEEFLSSAPSHKH